LYYPARHLTGSVGGGDLEHPMATVLKALKGLPVDEKLNVLLAGILNLQKLDSRIENTEKYSVAYIVSDQRIKLLEYKQLENEARKSVINLIFSGFHENREEWENARGFFVFWKTS
jgi:hypothetical protein